MPLRILVAELKQETATFNPALTVYSDFRIYRGPEVMTAYRGTKTELSGAFTVFDEDGRFEIVPTMAADAVSGGPIATPDLDRLLSEIEDAVRNNSDVDAAYICLHGAMAGQDEGDPEGRLLTRLRDILGDIPLVASIDLHCVLTDRMIEAVDILVPYHTYPHTDHYETGQRAARNLIALLDGRAKPTVARVQIPMLVRGDELLTATGRFGDAIRMCQEVEASENGLSAGVIIGNAFTDVPALQSNVLITTNNDLDFAQREADRIAKFMWDNRELFQATLTPLDEAISQACKTDGLVVFSDAADATASGAAGDSNAILKGLIANQFPKRTLIPIVDAPAVAVAFDGGVSSEVTVTLGGTRDFTRFEPVSVTARVRSLHDGEFTYENGTIGHGGRTAVLIAGAISLLVTERPVYVVGRRVFQAFGLEPEDFDLVVVKSPNGFRTWYESIASLIVAVDVPGSTSANLKSLPFKHCVRPIFPLDEDVQFPG
ncbi:MAG: M81 family metallopeptidase [Rhodopirellula sp.]|nr:M81 family metallopeptidase [Rhodopirellula sp.]